MTPTNWCIVALSFNLNLDRAEQGDKNSGLAYLRDCIYIIKKVYENTFGAGSFGFQIVCEVKQDVLMQIISL